MTEKLTRKKMIKKLRSAQNVAQFLVKMQSFAQSVVKK